MNREIINALMPAFFASMGIIFGVCVVFAPDLPEATRTAALTVAGAAIAGGAGLAQPRD